MSNESTVSPRPPSTIYLVSRLIVCGLELSSLYMLGKSNVNASNYARFHNHCWVGIPYQCRIWLRQWAIRSDRQPHHCRVKNRQLSARFGSDNGQSAVMGQPHHCQVKNQQLYMVKKIKKCVSQNSDSDLLNVNVPSSARTSWATQ
jgi:hypothetical protein